MGLLSKLLSTISGNNDLKVSEQLLFDKIIGFRNIVPGCGASTFVQNAAIALSEKTRYNICVLDTNFLYPIQYPLLSTSELKVKELDILDFSGELSKVIRNTSYTNVYIAQLEHRTIVDILSGKDTEEGIVRFIANLKSYFDIILVDLSCELTNLNIHSAIKCNKIYQVADTSLKCLYYIKKSVNTMVTLGVPLAKANKVILNKELNDVVLGVDKALEDAGLDIVARVPLSYDIAIACASGKRLYGALNKDKGVTAFNIAMENILNDMIEKTPLNSKFLDVSKELERMERKNTKNSDYLVEESGSDFIIEENVEVLDDDYLDSTYTEETIDTIAEANEVIEENLNEVSLEEVDSEDNFEDAVEDSNIENDIDLSEEEVNKDD